MKKYIKLLVVLPIVGLLIVFGFIIASVFGGYELTESQTTTLGLLCLGSVAALVALDVYFSSIDLY